MNKKTFMIVVFSLALIVGLSACSLSLAQDIAPPPGYQAPVYEEPELISGAFPQQLPDLANGAAIYQEKCLPCHGDAGLGDGPNSSGLPVPVAQIGNPDLAANSAPLAWYTMVLNGNIERFMPPFSASLNDQDVWDVLAYVYSFSASEAQVAAGASVYTDTCAACHGLEGEGPVAPGALDFRNAEQLVTYSIQDLVQKAATGNGNPDHVFSTVLDEAQQTAVAAYLQSLALPVTDQAAENIASQDESPAAEEPASEAAAPTEQPADAGTPETVEEPGAEGDGLGTVTGRVVNGSGGDLPEDLQVTLEVYQTFEILYTETVPAAQDGSFVFENVAFDPELIYITVVELDGTFFPSDFHMGNETLGDSIDLPVTIYDITAEPDTLSVSRMHVFFQFIDQDTVQVIHQVSISNFGGLMVAPAADGAPVLNFSLPENATNLIFQSGTLGNPYLKTATGFADPSPVMPGSSTYDGLFAYEIPYDGKLEWVLPIDLPTDLAVIFVQGEEVKVESGTLEASGNEAVETEIYQVLVANALSAGQEIDLKISSGFAGGLKLDGNLLTIVLGVVGLGLAGLGAWRFFRQGEDDYEDEEPEDNAADLLMDEIVQLDEAFVAGEMDEETYQDRRKSLKAQLTRIMNQKEAE